MLDSLRVRFPSPFPEGKALQRRAWKAGLSEIETKLSDSRDRVQGKAAYRIGGPKGGMCFYLEKETWRSNFVNALTVHLSHFPSFFDAYALLRKMFSDEELLQLTISRLDVCVDIFDIPFEQVLSGLVVGLKQKVQGWGVRGTQHTGLSFGSGNDVLTLYDKAARSKSKDGRHHARLEISLGGNKLPSYRRMADKKLLVRRLNQIPLLFEAVRSRQFQPFKHIGISHIQLIDEQELHHLPDSQKVTRSIRYGELRALTEFAGIGTARKVLGKNRNFRRDYEPLIAAMDPMVNINWLFEQSLIEFLDGCEPEINVPPSPTNLSLTQSKNPNRRQTYEIEL